MPYITTEALRSIKDDADAVVNRTGDYLAAADDLAEFVTDLLAKTETAEDADAGLADATESTRYGWYGWESEEEDTDGVARPGVYYLTVFAPGGDEYAIIVHRVTDNPLSAIDGPWATEKLERAQRIVDALNA